MTLEESLFYDFVTLLAIVNPIQAAATFATLTVGASPAQEKRIATRACVTAFIIMVVFGFVGQYLLQALGITFGAFRVAGGILLLLVGLNMVFLKPASEHESGGGSPADDPSIFPLAIPMISGPGALTTIVALISKRRESPVEVALVVVIAALVIAITLFAMRISQPLLKFFGTSGINAISRIMGVLVASIAVQLIVMGLKELFPILTIQR